jgi:hypothetical protein
MSLLKEFPDMADLRLVIVFANITVKLYFLYLVAALLLPRLALLPALFVPVLAEIHYPAYGRLRFGRDLDQVKTLCLGFAQSFLCGHNTQHGPVLLNATHLRDPYSFIGSNE